MARYARRYVIQDIAKVHLAFAKALRTANQMNAADRARRRPQRARRTVSVLNAMYAQYSRDLDAAAVLGAEAATKAIIKRLDETRVRPVTDKRRHLNTLIVSRPISLGLRGLATGAVGVADIAELDKAIDPDYPHKGPYWRAQEKGTSKHVGREITGFFHGAAAAEPPRAIYAGGGGPHSAFSPSSKFTPAAGQGSRGGKGGKGTINTPLKARYFIRDGADAGRAEWKAAVLAATAAAVRTPVPVGRGKR